MSLSKKQALDAAILGLNTMLAPDATSAEDGKWLDEVTPEAVTLLARMREELPQVDTLPRKEVYVVCWVYWNGVEQGGGGFEWGPDMGEMRTYFDGEAGRWAGGDSTVRVRFVAVDVPDFGGGEAGRLQVTEYLNADTDWFEAEAPPIDSILVYSDDDGRRVLLRHLVHVVGVGYREGVGEAEQAEITRYIRDFPDDDPLTALLKQTFPEEADRASRYDLEDTITTSDAFIAAKDLLDVADPPEGEMQEVDPEYVRAACEIVANTLHLTEDGVSERVAELLGFDPAWVWGPNRKDKR